MIPEFPEDIVYLEKSDRHPNLYDVSLSNIDKLRDYDSIEVHIVLYPYSRRITSEHISFFPFEEYVKDVQSNQLSAYSKIQLKFHKFFGVALGSVIAGFFYKYKPEDLFSVESVVAVFAAYAIGKELWADLERFFINISKRWRLRYTEDYYKYELEKFTTMAHYSSLAKRKRYGKVTLLPEKINFLELSNSQTLRMHFNMKDIKPAEAKSAHIFSIHIEPSLQSDFEKYGHLFGVKLSLNKKTLGFTKRLELFQSLHNREKGCLDDEEVWSANSIFCRKAITLGKIKFFVGRDLLSGKSLVRYVEQKFRKKR
ncbi:MAG TPA: hypothetical protein PK079_11815 [Leptospiraceae bacterium]|nr:hypothetical protein [Leptospiraceae bacterium]HMX33734.1 hypothetical protein [Leptospiraceae bacterium]HMY33217.1 hypothetical protein [Leptospiraceae bacterium]HMZ65087.1 hypothetical protein [Leptospiraceae bacterium]HNA08765.1 hypothetical protein [Leptospiraceae bacterium]